MIYRIVTATLLASTCLIGCASDIGNDEPKQDTDVTVEESQLAGEPSLGHCTVEVDVSSDGKDEVAAQKTPTCFKTFAESVAFATDGRVQLGPNETPDTVTDETLNGSNAADAVQRIVIGTDYQHTEFRGSSFTWFGSSTCAPGRGYKEPRMPSGWNDKVSSARSFGNCRFRHWEHTGYRGAIRTVPRNGSIRNFGAMNDETSSLQWLH